MTEAFLKTLLKKLRCALGCDETGSDGKYSPDCTPVQFGGERGVPFKMPNRDQYEGVYVDKCGSTGILAVPSTAKQLIDLGRAQFHLQLITCALARRLVRPPAQKPCAMAKAPAGHLIVDHFHNQFRS